MKKHNFYAGPSILSEYTIKNTADAVLDFAGTGLSLLEVSHRSKEFVAVMDEARALVKELLDVPQGYDVIFVGGGASMQFCMVPYNILKTKAAYLETGTWAEKAIKEAKLFGEVEVVASSKDAISAIFPRIIPFPKMSIIFISPRTIRYSVRKCVLTRCKSSFGSRYVVRYILSSGRCLQICSHICRCTEKSGTRRGYRRYCS